LREFFASATIAALVDLPFVFVFAVIVWLMGGVAAVPAGDWRGAGNRGWDLACNGRLRLQ